MAKIQITINVDEGTKRALTAAAANAGQSLSAYLARAGNERMIRDAAARYRQVIADNREFAAEIDAARAAGEQAGAEVREQVLAKYPNPA